MVYGVLRLINFAHGDVYMVGAYGGLLAAAWISAASHPGPACAVLVMLGSMVGCAILGLVIERFAYRPLRRAPRLTALITAIGVSLLLEGIVQQGRFLEFIFRHPGIFGPDPRYFPPEMGASRPLVHTASVTLQSNDAIITVTAFGLMALLWYIVTRTRIRKAMLV